MSYLPIWAQNSITAGASTRYATGVSYIKPLDQTLVTAGVKNYEQPYATMINAYLRELTGIIDERITYGCLEWNNSKIYHIGAFVRIKQQNSENYSFFECIATTQSGESPFSNSTKWRNIIARASTTNNGLVYADLIHGLETLCVAPGACVWLLGKNTSEINYGMFVSKDISNPRTMKTAGRGLNLGPRFLGGIQLPNIYTPQTIEYMRIKKNAITPQEVQKRIEETLKQKYATKSNIVLNVTDIDTYIDLDTANFPSVITIKKACIGATKVQISPSVGSIYIEGKKYQNITLNTPGIFKIYYVSSQYVFIDLLTAPLWSISFY